MNGHGNGAALLQEHEVLFLDFLGFAEAVRSWDDERMGKADRAIEGNRQRSVVL
jgi:hypothetical protein